MTYDAAGNLGGDSSVSYDASGQQISYAGGPTQSYDGDRLRAKKVESGATTYYLRSSVLGSQVVAEVDASGNWARGYVYLGGQMVAIQSSGVNWVHQDPVTKSQRLTNSSGVVTSTVDLDPWGGDTNRSSNQAFQPHRYTTYTRDGDGGDDAMMRRYGSYWSRFSQPDPYDGSYNLADPQSFNRYAYVQNDPVNFIDPSGLDPALFGLLQLWAQMNSGAWSVTTYASSDGPRIVSGPFSVDEGPSEGVPQNPMPLSLAEINQLKGDLQGMLKGTCLDFVKAVLKKLNSPTDDLMNVFGKVTEFDRKAMVGASASVGGSLGMIDAGMRAGLSITINFSLSGDAKGRSMDTRVMIHELVHAATASKVNQVFHYQMDQAAWDVATAMGRKNIGQRPQFTPPKGQLDKSEALFFDRRLSEFCPN